MNDKNNEHPNIVFFFTDDQRFDTIAALGNKEIYTPNIDKLVKNGTTFTHAHIPCGTCGAICMPSRAMLHTGRTLFHLYESGREIPLEHTTLGETLRNNGYTTFGTGKWHNGREAFNRSFSCGDEIFFGGMSDHWNVPVYRYDPTGRYDKVCLRVDDPFYSNKTTEVFCDHINAGKHSSEMVCDAALDFLKSYNQQTPFFLYISFLAPHDPRTMPKRFLEMYDPDKITLPPNFMGGHPFDNGAIRVRDELLAGFPRTPEETKRHIAEYYAMISHLDYELGRVMNTLKEKGMEENTIIIFSGDNGLALGQHGLFGKQNCYEHSVRVPLILSGPGIPKGKQTNAFVYLLDIFPTICDLLKIKTPESVEGKSFAEIISGETEKTRDSLFFAYSEFQRAIKTEDYKLIEYVTNGKHTVTQLFNLKEDPFECKNLASCKEYSDLIANLRKIMFEFRDEWGDMETEWGKIFWQGIKNTN